MGLSELLSNFKDYITQPQVMSYRYLQEMRPYLEANSWNPEQTVDGKNYLVEWTAEEKRFELLPRSVITKMRPLTWTAYETVRETFLKPAALTYTFGRRLRERRSFDEIEWTKTDEKINEYFRTDYPAKAATEFYFHEVAPVSSALDKIVGYTLGVVGLPIGFIAGLCVRPKISKSIFQ